MQYFNALYLIMHLYVVFVICAAKATILTRVYCYTQADKPALLQIVHNIYRESICGERFFTIEYNRSGIQ